MSEPLIVETNDHPSRAVIWLHGLGASGYDFQPIVPELNLPNEPGVRFIFPHAPNIPVTINGGMEMPAWYDILEMSITRKVDVERLRASAQTVHELIDDQIAAGIASNHIAIAGFSQGGAVAYEAALTYTKPLAGLMAMSTYFATAESITPHDANDELPIIVYHGTRDPVVAEQAGHAAVDVLRAMGRKPEYKTYPMEHMVSLEQIRDFSTQFRDWFDLKD